MQCSARATDDARELWGMAVSSNLRLSEWPMALAGAGKATESVRLDRAQATTARVAHTVDFTSISYWDGSTSIFQEKSFKEHVTSECNQMLYINHGSCVISPGTFRVSDVSLQRAGSRDRIHLVPEFKGVMVCVS